MLRTLAIFALLGGMACGDQAPEQAGIERAGIEHSIAALYLPEVRADKDRMGALLTPDFDGNLESIPTRNVWPEASWPSGSGDAQPSFRIASLRFATPELALVDGETVFPRSAPVPIGASWDGTLIYAPILSRTFPAAWFMILKKDGPGWRIALFRSVTASLRN
jgi:hypothetical protein